MMKKYKMITFCVLIAAGVTSCEGCLFPDLQPCKDGGGGYL